MSGNLWAVVPAGGAGTRLWPLSRASSPKFLHDLTGSGRSLLVETLERLEPVAGERIMVVTGRLHAEAVRRQAGGLAQVLAEPSPRDSMAAIGLAAAIVERGDPDGIVGSFAADHVIADREAFARCVAEAVEVAATGLIVTLGIVPDHPATGFGYLRVGDPLPGFPTARAVVEFVEKPDLEHARAWVASGEYRWNAGMFLARAGVLLDELAVDHPRLAGGLRAIAAEPERLEEIWPELTAIAIDHAVAEPAAARGRVAVVPADLGWTDVGDYAALGDLLGDDPGALIVLGPEDRVVGIDASGLVVPGSDRTIAVLGLDDVVVVDTDDALLVTTRAQAQRVRAVVERLRQEGRPVT